MKMWYITLISCACVVLMLDAAPGIIRVKNSNKEIKLGIKNGDLTPITAGEKIYQQTYRVQPNEMQLIPVPQIPGSYRLAFEFHGLEGYGTVTPKVEVKTQNQLITLPDQTQNYNSFAAYKKQQQTSVPEAPCIGVGC